MQDEGYRIWLGKRMAKTARKVEKARAALAGDPRARYRLRDATMLSRALTDAQDYLRISENYQARCAQVMGMLERELARCQITAALYQGIARALKGEE